MAFNELLEIGWEDEEWSARLTGRHRGKELEGDGGYNAMSARAMAALCLLLFSG